MNILPVWQPLQKYRNAFDLLWHVCWLLDNESGVSLPCTASAECSNTGRDFGRSQVLLHLTCALCPQLAVNTVRFIIAMATKYSSCPICLPVSSKLLFTHAPSLAPFRAQLHAALLDIYIHCIIITDVRILCTSLTPRRIVE